MTESFTLWLELHFASVQYKESPDFFTTQANVIQVEDDTFAVEFTDGKCAKRTTLEVPLL